MRAHIPSYQIVTPASLTEALELLSSESAKWRPFAGGTDLMVLLESGKLQHRDYLNIWSLDELRGIAIESDEVLLGPLTTFTDVQANLVLREEFPMLCQAASETGGLAIQNRGTLGGNIVNASPAADSPPALLAYDARLELTNATGTRWIEYKDFHTGYKEMELRPGELMTKIGLPRVTSKRVHYYRKVGTRKAQAISKVCFAGVATIENLQVSDIRVVLGSVAPVPLRCVGTEESLRGGPINEQTISRAAATLSTEIAPIDDIRSTETYRRRVSVNLLKDFLSSLT